MGTSTAREKAGESLYDYDYQSLVPLVKSSRELDIAIVVVHHERKQEAENSLDRVSGSTGLTAAADAIVILTRTGNRSMLAGRGRDLEEFEWPMKLEDGRWCIEGEVHKLPRTNSASSMSFAGLGNRCPRNACHRALAQRGWPVQSIVLDANCLAAPLLARS